MLPCYKNATRTYEGGTARYGVKNTRVTQTRFQYKQIVNSPSAVPTR